MSQCLIGFFPLMVITVLKDRGGSALTVMKYSTQPRCARATTAIHFLAIAGSVDVCLYCPTCGVRTPCAASEKAILARAQHDFVWAEDLEYYCAENTTHVIRCSTCHAR